MYPSTLSNSQPSTLGHSVKGLQACTVVLDNNIFYFKLFCVYGVLPSYMSVYHIYAWCMKRTEEGVEPSGTGIIDGCELPSGSR